MPSAEAAAKPDTTVLIATDIRTDADVIKRLLGTDFGNVAVSSNPELAAKDFERHQPRVLLLAFNSLEKAERYYLGLYRFSRVIHSIPHRTLILCNKDEVRPVYELCRKEFFDDYVLFWPLSHDGPRLQMSVQLALRQLSGGNNLPSVSQLAIQVRRIAALEALLKEAMTDIDARISTAGLRLQEAEAETGLAFDTFSRDLVSGKFAASVEVKDAMALGIEMDRLKTSGLQMPLRAAIESARPIRQWVGDFGEKVGPHIEAVRELQSLADRVRARVLIVDDDPLQLRLVSAALAEEGYDLDTALSGTGALKLAQKRRPDLILLDVNLPDISGVEVLQRLKASSQCNNVPVVMLTGNSERQIVLDCMQAGANSFVVKPVDRALLISRLSEFIQAGKDRG